MSYQVNIPGFAVDGATAEVRLDKFPLPVAIETMKWSDETQREIIHYLGDSDPQERTGGANNYTLDGSIPIRQFIRMVLEVVGNNVEGAAQDDALKRFKQIEFTITVCLRPDGDDTIYTIEFQRVTFDKHDWSGIEPKGKSTVNFSATAMKMRLGTAAA